MDFLGNDSGLVLAGLVAALLFTGLIAGLMAGLLGVGGGIVIVPVLFHIFSFFEVDPAIRMHLAVGTSLATIIPTSVMSARSHHARRSIDKELLRSLGLYVFVGASVGSVLSAYVSGGVLSLIFASVALIVALRMALGREGNAIWPNMPGHPFKGLTGFLIGKLSVLMGIGGGTLGVPILSAFNFPIRRAVGTASAFGVIIGIPGCIGFGLSGIGVPELPPGSIGYVNLIGACLIVPVTMRMAPIGASIAHRINPGYLRLVFAAFLTATSIRMILEIIG